MALPASYRGTAALSRHPSSQRVDRGRPAALFRPLREAGFGRPKAPVAELVDALDSKSSSARSAGSIPARGTTLRCFSATLGAAIPTHVHPITTSLQARTKQ